MVRSVWIGTGLASLLLAGPALAECACDEPRSAEGWLSKIEQRAGEIETLKATIRYDRAQPLLGDQQRRFGQLLYDAGPPARFRIHFDRLLIHDQPERQDRYYIFDGRWLAERDDDDRVFIRRELAEADEAEQDLLALGEGPIALPLNLEKDLVLERFAVELVEDDERDAPADTVLLRLRPREGLDMDEPHIDVWYDREELLPVQVFTHDPEGAGQGVGGVETTVRVMDFELNRELSETVFDTSAPEEAGWQVEEHRLGD